MGSVQVYEWNGSAWVSRGNTFSGIDDNGLTGSSVALSSNGDTLAYGSSRALNETEIKLVK